MRALLCGFSEASVTEIILEFLLLGFKVGAESVPLAVTCPWPVSRAVISSRSSNVVRPRYQCGLTLELAGATPQSGLFSAQLFGQQIAWPRVRPHSGAHKRCSWRRILVLTSRVVASESNGRGGRAT